MGSSLITLWHDQRVRQLLYQVSLGLFLVFIVWALVSNTVSNMAARGISPGLSFLSGPANFSIAQVLIEFTPRSSAARAFVVGLLNTLIVSFLGVIFATLAGFVLGVMRLSDNPLVRSVATCYVEIFRNVPLLLQIFFWYTAILKPLPTPRDVYEKGQEVFLGITNRGLHIPAPETDASFTWVWLIFLLGVAVTFFLARFAKKRRLATGKDFPILTVGVGLILVLPALVFVALGSPLALISSEMGNFRLEGGITIIPEFVALLVALSMYTAAFIGEIVRSGIQAVPKGQTEAARALGLKHGRILRMVIIPQAMRVIIPPLTSQYLNLTKNSSLAVAIAYPDLVAVFAGTILNQTGRAVEIIAITMGVYLLLSLIISGLLNYYNARAKLITR